MAVQKKQRLGDLLVQGGLLTEEKLQSALAAQKEKRMKLGDTLVEMGYVDEEQLLFALEELLHLERVDLLRSKIDDNAVHLITEDLAKKYTLIPVNYDPKNPNILRVAMADPLDFYAMDDLTLVTNLQIEPVLATKAQIAYQVDKYFGKEQAMAAAERYQKEREEEQAFLTENISENTAQVEDSPIVFLVTGIIEKAVRNRSSDIHIEALPEIVRIRYRIDGNLKEDASYNITLLPAIVARIKIISGLDIAEKRKPQDGRATQIVDRKEYDIRVSILPTVFGEKVVMRLTAKANLSRDKKLLGLNPQELDRFEKILKNPNGIILVTGPTGSGKSTTLYTALSELNTEDVNIITVQDPVEANINGINQVQVNVKAEMTFANALRSILRQDPDIIMIGEIRDGETAEIAVRAAITGHLVVSTLHTNGTGATITRLADMGIEPYLIGDSLVGVIAQRLVRRLCLDCRDKGAYQADTFEKTELGLDSNEELTLYRPTGCVSCNFTGYRGRIGVYEIMPISTKLKRAISTRATAEEITNLARDEGMRTLRDSAIDLIKEGITTISEMNKITYAEQVEEEQ